MKKFFSILLAAMLSCAAALATLPTYHTLSGYGNGTLPSTVATTYFPSDPNSQIRVIYVNYSSDTNNGALAFASGSTAYWNTATNATPSSITNWINSTNGLYVGAPIVLEHRGIPYYQTVTNWNAYPVTNAATGTITYTNNLVTLSGGFGVATAIGDNIFLMNLTAAIPVGAQTNVINGDAIFVGNYGRPVQVQVIPSYLTNRLNMVSTHYDSASQ